ncbi:hypothetical protein [Candidatus Binatus sp.]|uniref:hypothetical protein n=1 Tax=Candidatus Binatus sp. TaxID=2811406 RepID=UPI003CC68F9A
MNFWQQQQQHQNALDLVDRMGKFQADLSEKKIDRLNSGQSAPDMVKGLQTDASDLINKYTTDPANRTIAPQLALSTRAHVADQMQSFPAEATERVYHDLDFKFNQQTSAAAAMIGQNYTVKGADTPNPTFVLNGDGLAAMQRQAAAIDQAYPPNARPMENQYYRNLLAQKAAFQTGVSIATNPANSALIDSYIKQHAEVLTPEQQITLQNQATATMRRPAEEQNARNANLDASLTAKYLQQVKNGNLDVAGITDDAAHQRISGPNFQRVTGYQYVPPGDPSSIADMSEQIKSAKSDDQLIALEGAIQGQSDKAVYGKGAIDLTKQIEIQRQQIKSGAGKAKADGQDAIDDYFKSISPLSRTMYDEAATTYGMPKLNQLHATATKDFDRHTRDEQDLGKIQDSRDSALKNNRPDFSMIEKFVKDAPPQNPGESAADYWNRVSKWMASRHSTGANP